MDVQKKIYRLLCILAAASSQFACADSPTQSNTAPDTIPFSMSVLGLGSVPERYTSELWVHGLYAYTGTWGRRGVNSGNVLKVWNVAGNSPVLVDSVIIGNAVTLGDVQVSEDGKLMVVATEFRPGSIVLYDLTNPAKPTLLSKFHSPNTEPGVHTATLARVAGRQYAFLAVDPPARLVIVDLTNPAEPFEVFAQAMGNPYIHDVYVREGLLFTALWDDGVAIWDIGGGSHGGTVSNPVRLGSLKTQASRPSSGSSVHNVASYQQAAGARNYLFIGEEVPVAFGTSSAGDIHVVDISELTAPREVAFFTVEGAGTHNFSIDEARGLLYAAYYNAGIQVLDIKGDLSACVSGQRDNVGRCALRKMGRLVANALAANTPPVYVWGVHFAGQHLYSSDMLNGLWKLDARGVPDRSDRT